MPYDLKPMTTPRLTGAALAISAPVVENRVLSALLAPKLLNDAGVTRFRAAQVDDAPSVRPPIPGVATVEDTDGPAPDLHALRDGGAASTAAGFAPERAADFVRAYREKRATPEEVAKRVIEAVKASNESDPPLRAIVMQDEADVMAQARASAERWRAGAPLGPLDGVPVAIKDEVDQPPYPTTVGTKFIRELPREDATVVARLRAAGALLIGKANMYEIGIDPTGFNAFHGAARNPHDPQRNTGGSSSGPAAAVAAGLCPISVGADGGGSIRIPAALCGQVGLKATWGRISEHGAFPLAWSVGHVGPIAATARDCALAYLIMAGRDPRDAPTHAQPRPHLREMERADLAGLRVGVYPAWFDDAAPEIVAACKKLVAEFESRGAKRVEVEIPDLDVARVAHVVTIASEMAASMERYYREHRTDFSLPVRVALVLARHLSSRDYVHAQRWRTRLSKHFDHAFEACDVLVSPTTAITAPPYLPDTFPRGESHLFQTSALMRFIFPMNFTGAPAISFPAGYDAAGLPIGLHATARPWEEHVLFRLAEIADGIVEKRAPKVHYRLLPN